MLEVPYETMEACYQRMLTEREDEINHLVKDIMDMKIESIRKTRCSDMAAILNLFSGTTPGKKKDELIEFLRLMPAYRTCDKEVLRNRLEYLKATIKQRDKISDLLVYAKLKHQKEEEQKEEELVE